VRQREVWIGVTKNDGTSLPEGGKARRVYLLLRDEMSNGTYPPGTLLPGEQRLAEIFAVSRVTVRRALDALDMDGLIARRAGSGTIVRAQEGGGAVAADFASLIPQLVEMGQSTTARLLSFSYGAAPAQVAQDMGLTRHARVQTAVRVRSLGGRPFRTLLPTFPKISPRITPRPILPRRHCSGCLSGRASPSSQLSNR
jgi:GntR family transcriptional regulator